MSIPEMNQPYRETYRIRSYESDNRNRVKISSIFNYMQEIASNHAALLNFGFDDLEKEGLFWVLSRAKININNYLKTWDDFIVETWPKNIVKLFANRDFRFYSSKGDIIGSATSAWLMINQNSMRPARPEQYLKDIHSIDVPPGIDEFLDKIDTPVDLIPAGNFSLGYKDIDINQHTNNARYIEYLLDCCEPKLLNNEICSIQVNFLNQTKSGDSLNIFITKEEFGDIPYIEAKDSQEKKIFNSLIQWRHL